MKTSLTQTMAMEHIVIIGNGIAGSTLARHVRKLSNKRITMISAEHDNFFSRTALMYVYMGHMRFKDTEPYPKSFWADNDIALVHDKVKCIDVQHQVLSLEKGERLAYDKLVLATGSRPNELKLKGEELLGVQGLYSKQDLEYMKANTMGVEHAVIVGGGLIGVEMAEMLLSRNITVDFIVRDTHFWGSVLPQADAQFVDQHLQKHHGLTLHFSEELEEILGADVGRVKGVRTLHGQKEIQCDFVGVTIGVHPNIAVTFESDIAVNRGILVDEYLATNIPNVYAIGDCTEQKNPLPGRKAIEQVWYTGRMMGETLAQTLCGNPTKYSPGNWFNSAKFFDLEYQTYGSVQAQLQAGEEEFVFQSKNGKVLVHFVYEEQTKALIGVNAFGIRLRHEVFDHWLNQQTPITEVLTNFESAVFDPEFFTQYGAEIISVFNTEKKMNIALTPKKWWQKLIQA
ncbi:Pyridine nucleotide-disulphide oxidoreductase [Lishizhenia tianjinensis]|uniref:Pyridine nucleotide-disulphide oxidoreductase n=1 Tax=Lishizhenia tianjinensis TaxID=477690 RepID=A0A1I7AR43_9FLAO|nr:FAD-dependent oxidoreductase [Lishizhenia tianjinensis]SFT77376.1 Pyridine nucleotide-disulphide oxidoreductase [Lishizhenia tianjinensis]